MLRVFLAALLVPAGLASCRHTRVEVETVVSPDGSAVRTITVHSEDDGKPAEHPDDLLEPGAGYTILQRTDGLLRAQGNFPSVDAAGPGFGFRAAGNQTATSGIRFRKQDWVLFDHYSYRELVQDVVDPDEIKAALDEAAATAAELIEAAFGDLFGEDFDDTLLRKRLRTDLREMFRECAFVLWQEFSRPQRVEGEDSMPRIFRRFAFIAQRYGLEVDAGRMQKAFEKEQDPRALAALRRAAAVWVGEGLRPLEDQDRFTPVPNLEDLLFEGALEFALLQAVTARFGSPEKGKDWLESLSDRLFGAFGPNRGDLSFRLRVRMPGKLLRSNGYLQDEFWTFLEFPAGDVYPDGRGIECESVVWQAGVAGNLPAIIVPDNQTALAWMWVLGEGPDEGPDETLAELVRRCVATRSLTPLDEFLRPEPGVEQDQKRLRRAAGVLAWLEGERD